MTFLNSTLRANSWSIKRKPTRKTSLRIFSWLKTKMLLSNNSNRKSRQPLRKNSAKALICQRWSKDGMNGLGQASITPSMRKEYRGPNKWSKTKYKSSKTWEETLRWRVWWLTLRTATKSLHTSTGSKNCPTNIKIRNSSRSRWIQVLERNGQPCRHLRDRCNLMYLQRPAKS